MNNRQPLRVTLIRSRAIDPAVNKVALALANSGYTVDLLVWSREGKRLQVNQEKAYRIKSFNLKAPYYKLRLILYLPLWWFYEFFFLLRSKTDIIHACDLDTLIPAVAAKIIKRNKLCYTIYDFYADILPRQIPNIIRKLIAFTERSFLRFVDALFLVDKSRYQQITNARIKRIEYLYNSPDDYYETEAASEQTSEINLFYAGYLDESRGLGNVINAISKLNGINLTIAGTGPYKDAIQHRTSNLKNLKYVGWIPYEEVIANSLKSDILFAFYDPAIPGNKYASPNKLFEAMMCAKPIMVNEGTTASNIVAEEECGLIMPYGDVEAIKESLIKLKKDSNLRQVLGTNGRTAYEKRYSWKIMCDRLLSAYEMIMKPA